MFLSPRELRRIQQQISNQEETNANERRQRQLKQDKAKKRHRAGDQLEVDMVDHHRARLDWLDAIPEAPTFRPTSEEFADPFAYIRSIQQEGAASGICKIVPPMSVAVPAGLVLAKASSRGFKFTARHQRLAEPTRSSFASMHPFCDGTRKYTVSKFEKMADEFTRKRFGSAGNLPPRLVEAEYWRARSEGGGARVEYGNDVDGSAFSDNDPIGATDWNLNKLPRGKDSVLRGLTYPVPGVSSPLLYIGMLFANFAWHVEDHWLYSINFQHLGAPKTWYGVPASSADGFENVAFHDVLSTATVALKAEGASQQAAADAAAWHLLKKTTMFSPQLLVEAGVRVTRVVQHPGEFVITFPRAYHSGFSNGFCVGEADNFGLVEWLVYGAEARQQYRALRKTAILPFEQLLVKQFSPLTDSESRPPGEVSGSPAGVAQRVFVQHLRSLNAARAAVAAASIPVLRLPAGLLSCHCSRCGDLVSLAICLVRGRAADASQQPGADGCLENHARKSAYPLRSHGAMPRGVQPSQPGSSNEISEPASLAKHDTQQKQQAQHCKRPAELVCLPCLADSLAVTNSKASDRGGRESKDGGNAARQTCGTVGFLHPDLERMEALAQQFEADPEAAYKGDMAQLSLGGLSGEAFAPLGDFEWAEPLSAEATADNALVQELDHCISVAQPVPGPDAAMLEAKAEERATKGNVLKFPTAKRKATSTGRPVGRPRIKGRAAAAKPYSRASRSAKIQWSSSDASADTIVPPVSIIGGHKESSSPAAAIDSNPSAIKHEQPKSPYTAVTSSDCRPLPVAALHGGLLSLPRQRKRVHKPPAGTRETFDHLSPKAGAARNAALNMPQADGSVRPTARRKRTPFAALAKLKELRGSASGKR